MKNRITIGVPLADILAPYPETTAKKIEGELKRASKPVKAGVHRITAEALFKILQQNGLFQRQKDKLSSFQGTNIRSARKEAAIQFIKSVLRQDGDQSPKVIYGRYEEKAKSLGEMPYTYAWFRVLYGEFRRDEK